MNSFGTKFRVSIFGESHGEMIGVVLDGVPAGMPLAVEDFLPDLARRRSGGRGTTARHEQDIPRIAAGLHDGHTTGAPLAIVFTNSDTRSSDYASLADHPRPSHADFVARCKFGGFNDPRGGGHFSGRLTLTLVAAGVVARRMLDGMEITSRIVSIGGCSDQTEFESVVEAAMADGDSVGGIVECCATGVPVGLGEPFFDSVESLAAHLLFAIPAVKGVEFGNGFAAGALRGSQNNDPILDLSGRTATNNAGGVVGGIANGNPLVIRVAVKPTPSISRPQQTLDLRTGKPEPLVIRGRHDACIVLRAPVVVESAVAIALAQLIPDRVR